ncbi:MAG: FAD-dependent oxidoreductase [Chthoniobacterales bacterium]
MPDRIAIIGAGVSGLTSGVVLAESGRAVTILAAESGSETTSAAAAAIWFPYDAGEGRAVIDWALATRERLLVLTGQAGTGVSLLELRCLARAGVIAIPAWAVGLGARSLRADELPLEFASGYALDAPLMDAAPYLRYLAARFATAGGTLQTGVRFQRLENVPSEFALIVNCAGIGARKLVPDPALEGHRGQVALVPPQPLPYVLVCGGLPLMYAIPRAQDCVFGGTNDLSESGVADPRQTAEIVAECSRVLRIAPPPVLAERVGLRPFRRGGVCLRADALRDGRRVIHNYGHGGAGFTLSWGCAEEVAALI